MSRHQSKIHQKLQPEYGCSDGEVLETDVGCKMLVYVCIYIYMLVCVCGALHKVHAYIHSCKGIYIHMQTDTY